MQNIRRIPIGTASIGGWASRTPPNKLKEPLGLPTKFAYYMLQASPIPPQTVSLLWLPRPVEKPSTPLRGLSLYLPPPVQSGPRFRSLLWLSGRRQSSENLGGEVPC